MRKGEPVTIYQLYRGEWLAMRVNVDAEGAARLDLGADERAVPNALAARAPELLAVLERIAKGVYQRGIVLSGDDMAALARVEVEK